MHGRNTRWLPLLLVALLASGTALAQEHDELSKGNWDGKSKFAPSGGGGSGGGDPPPPPPEDPPEPEPGEGTPTPQPEDGGEGSGEPGEAPAGEGESGGEGQPGEASPGDGEGGEAGSGGDADGGDAPPAPPPPAPPSGCNGRWTLVELGPDPKLEESHSTFTLLLFRNDGFGFISNGYARAHSTSWFDWFASTATGHAGGKDFRVEMRLVGGCGNCAPRITVQGNSLLETRAQVKSFNGGVDASSFANSSGWTVWSGPLLCDDEAGVEVIARKGNSTLKAEKQGLGLEVVITTNRVYASLGGGKGDYKQLQGASVIQKVHNHGDVNVYAGGAENNCQAKVRVAHGMVFGGRTACGATGDYELEILATD